MSVVFANIIAREINGPNDKVIVGGSFIARAIFPNKYVDVVKQDCNTGDTILVWNPCSLNHKLNQGQFNNKTTFVLSDTLSEIFVRANKVSSQAIDVTVDWKDGQDIVPERNILNLQHIAYISDRPLDFLDYTDGMDLSKRGLGCEAGYIYILVELEGVKRVLMRLEGDIDDVAAQLCGGQFLDDCEFVAV